MRFGAVVAAVTMVAAAGCTGQDVKPQPFRVGVAMPTTGPHAQEGRDYLAGARLAAEVLSGKRHEIQLPESVRVDRRFQWQVTAVGQGSNTPDGFDALIGQAGKSRVGRPMVDSGLTPATYDPNIIHIGPSVEEMTEPLGDVLILRHVRRTGRLVLLDGDPGRPDARAHDRAIGDTMGCGGWQGGAAHSHAPTCSGDRPGEWVVRDLTAVGGGLPAAARQAREAHPDALVVAGGASGAQRVLAACRLVGYKPPLVLAVDEHPLSPDPGVGDTTGIIRSTAWSSTVAARGRYGRQIQVLYQRVTGRRMTAAAASGWTAMTVLATAVSTAGTTDPAGFQPVLSDIEVPSSATPMQWDWVAIDGSNRNTGARALAEEGSRDGWSVVAPPELAEQPR